MLDGSTRAPSARRRGAIRLTRPEMQWAEHDLPPVLAMPGAARVARQRGVELKDRVMSTSATLP
jgi:hypothetical protein